jgi:RNA polymerase sigma-70 factor (ECF subfamily)
VAAALVRHDVEADETGDEALVARALAGDAAAFAAIYERWSPRVLRFASARLGDRDEAEDVMQEVFVALMRCLPSYRGQSRFGTWLLGIAFHLICRAQRRRTRAGAMPIDEAEEAAMPAPSAEAALDASRALERCTTLLASQASRSQREIFRMCYAENHSTVAVARKLRRSPETVRATLCRTRRALLEATPGLLETLES